MVQTTECARCKFLQAALIVMIAVVKLARETSGALCPRQLQTPRLSSMWTSCAHMHLYQSTSTDHQDVDQHDCSSRRRGRSKHTSRLSILPPLEKSESSYLGCPVSRAAGRRSGWPLSPSLPTGGNHTSCNIGPTTAAPMGPAQYILRQRIASVGTRRSAQPRKYP